jgi:hypothetical protein
MCADRRLRTQRGQALVELLVAMLALVPLLFGIVWVGKLVDMQQATIAAARALAFECTVRIDACRSADAHPELADQTRRRFFASPGGVPRSDDVASGTVHRGDRNPLWTDRRGEPLLERFEDVTVAVVPARFDSPLAFAGGQGDAAFPGAVRVLSELAGPGRFGLDIEGGFVDARVRAHVARGRSAGDWVGRLLPAPVVLRAHRTILTDAWNASGPYGDAPDSVETRVTAGARLPGVEPAIDAGWLPVRGLLAVGAVLGFESRASLLRWHEIDVDLVPPDRLAEGPVAPPPAPDAGDRP